MTNAIGKFAVQIVVVLIIEKIIFTIVKMALKTIKKAKIRLRNRNAGPALTVVQ